MLPVEGSSAGTRQRADVPRMREHTRTRRECQPPTGQVASGPARRTGGGAHGRGATYHEPQGSTTAGEAGQRGRREAGGSPPPPGRPTCPPARVPLFMPTPSPAPPAPTARTAPPGSSMHAARGSAPAVALASAPAAAGWGGSRPRALASRGPPPGATRPHRDRLRKANRDARHGHRARYTPARPTRKSTCGMVGWYEAED